MEDNFFALGGDSILAIRVASRLRAALGAESRPGLLFTHPTVAALAAALPDTGRGAPGAATTRSRPPTAPPRPAAVVRPAAPVVPGQLRAGQHRVSDLRSRCGCAARSTTGGPAHRAGRPGGPARAAAHHVRRGGRPRRASASTPPSGSTCRGTSWSDTPPDGPRPRARRGCWHARVPPPSTWARARCCGRRLVRARRRRARPDPGDAPHRHRRLVHRGARPATWASCTRPRLHGRGPGPAPAAAPVRRLRGLAARPARPRPTPVAQLDLLAGDAGRGWPRWSCRPTGRGPPCGPRTARCWSSRCPPTLTDRLRETGRGARRHPVHDPARRLPGAARPLGRPGGRRGRHRRRPAASGPSWSAWSGSS